MVLYRLSPKNLDLQPTDGTSSARPQCSTSRALGYLLASSENREFCELIDNLPTVRYCPDFPSAGLEESAVGGSLAIQDHRQKLGVYHHLLRVPSVSSDGNTTERVDGLRTSCQWYSRPLAGRSSTLEFVYHTGTV